MCQVSKTQTRWHIENLWQENSPPDEFGTYYQAYVLFLRFCAYLIPWPFLVSFYLFYFFCPKWYLLPQDTEKLNIFFNCFWHWPQSSIFVTLGQFCVQSNKNTTFYRSFRESSDRSNNVNTMRMKSKVTNPFYLLKWLSSVQFSLWFSC